jgi:hypothetical protein
MISSTILIFPKFFFPSFSFRISFFFEKKIILGKILTFLKMIYNLCAEATKALWWYVCRKSLFFKVMPFMTKDSFEYCPLGLKDY